MANWAEQPLKDYNPKVDGQGVLKHASEGKKRAWDDHHGESDG